MAYKIQCPSCKVEFTLPHEDINTLEDLNYTTIDCRNPECNALLYGHEDRGIILFHEYMHEETKGIWSKDGSNTGYIDV